MPHSFECITLDTTDGVALLTLNRPDRLNSFTQKMHAELRQALDIVRAGRTDGSVRVLVITGAGRGFCAGQDLTDRPVSADTDPVDLGESIEKNYKPLVMGLRNLEMPVLCAVNGVAAGAGVSLALACDLVFAAKSANFIQSFSKLGIIPDTGGSWVLPRLVGTSRAMGLALLGDQLSAQTAQAWGLIWESVDDEQLMPTVMEIALKLAKGPTYAYAQTKKAIWSSSTNDFETHLDVEKEMIRACGHSADFREGVAAFIEKRAPRFIGK
jgi:2-(1,2-epoxy-1,2-dihydrophenyl)acetyl-CoA isomerase